MIIICTKYILLLCRSTMAQQPLPELLQLKYDEHHRGTALYNGLQVSYSFLIQHVNFIMQSFNLVYIVAVECVTMSHNPQVKEGGPPLLPIPCARGITPVRTSHGRSCPRRWCPYPGTMGWVITIICPCGPLATRDAHFSYAIWWDNGNPEGCCHDHGTTDKRDTGATS